MPNFDALRSAIIGPLVYLAKPSKPVALLACFPLSGNKNDVSRYNNSFSGNANYDTSPFYNSGQALKINTTTNYTALLNAPLNLKSDWSFDLCYYVGVYKDNSSKIHFGDIILYASPLHLTVYLGSTSKLSLNNYHVVGTNFDAVSYTWADKTLRVWGNGILKGGVSIESTVDTTDNILFECSAGYGAYMQYNNMRLVQKALGTTTSYPVPTALYTGYEPL